MSKSQNKRVGVTTEDGEVGVLDKTLTKTTSHVVIAAALAAMASAIAVDAMNIDKLNSRPTVDPEELSRLRTESSALAAAVAEKDVELARLRSELSSIVPEDGITQSHLDSIRSELDRVTLENANNLNIINAKNREIDSLTLQLTEVDAHTDSVVGAWHSLMLNSDGLVRSDLNVDTNGSSREKLESLASIMHQVSFDSSARDQLTIYERLTADIVRAWNESDSFSAIVQLNNGDEMTVPDKLGGVYNAVATSNFTVGISGLPYDSVRIEITERSRERFNTAAAKLDNQRVIINTDLGAGRAFVFADGSRESIGGDMGFEALFCARLLRWYGLKNRYDFTTTVTPVSNSSSLDVKLNIHLLQCPSIAYFGQPHEYALYNVLSAIFAAARSNLFTEHEFEQALVTAYYYSDLYTVDPLVSTRRIIKVAKDLDQYKYNNFKTKNVAWWPRIDTKEKLIASAAVVFSFMHTGWMSAAIGLETGEL